MAKKQKIEFMVSANTRRFAQGMKRVKSSTRETGRTMSAMFGGTTGMMLGGGGLVLGLGMIAKKSVQLAGDLEQTAVAFETFLGSADKAKDVIDDLMQFSTVTPFEPEQVLKAGKTLTALGVSTKHMMADLKAIGDIASGTGKDFNELAVIFGKARTAGRLDGRDLNQLLEAGVPIIKQLSRQFKIGEGDVRKYISSGKVGFEDLRVAFRALSGDGGRFFGMMEKQSKTFNGQMSTLNGNLKNIGITLGNELLPFLNKYVGAVNEIILVNNKLKESEKTRDKSEEKGYSGAYTTFMGSTGALEWDQAMQASGIELIKGVVTDQERRDYRKNFESRRAKSQLSVQPSESKGEKVLKEIKQEFTAFRQDISVSGGRYA